MKLNYNNSNNSQIILYLYNFFSQYRLYNE